MTISIVVSVVVFLMGLAALCAALIVRELLAARSVVTSADVQPPRMLLPVPMALEVPPARAIAPAEMRTVVLERKRPAVDPFDSAKTRLWEPPFRPQPSPPPFMTRLRVHGTPLPRDTDEFDSEYTEYTEVDDGRRVRFR